MKKFTLQLIVRNGSSQFIEVRLRYRIFLLGNLCLARCVVKSYQTGMQAPQKKPLSKRHGIVDGFMQKVAGGNQFFTFGETADWTGTFDGTSYDYGSGVIHANGSWSFKGIALFDAVTVDGKTGGLEMMVKGSKPDESSDWVGTWVLIEGEGELAGLRGQGALEGPGFKEEGKCGEIPYEGKVHFEFH